MKKFWLLLLVPLFLITGGLSTVVTSEELAGSTPEGGGVEFVLFYSESCPHCKEEIEFIEKKLEPEYGDLVEFNLYELSDPAAQDLIRQFSFFYKAEIRGVPMTFVDGSPVYGYDKDKTTGKQIQNLIDSKLRERGLLQDGGPVDDGEMFHILILGQIDLNNFSLPLLTVIIGLLDGFNPCAMWVLLFLISLLLGIEDRKRMWLLGGLFVLSSGLVYFFFMAAWLKFLMFVGMIFAVRIVVGSIAVGVGGKNLSDWWKNRKADGVVCKVSKQEGTKNTFDKIKDIVKRKSLWWSIFGILLLGFSVNLVEMACSAGFPAIFTQVLSMSDVPMWKRYIYMGVYIFFYMLDDMAIFAIAMFTLKSKTIGGKYAKYANLIGGFMIFILGLLLIFKPEWLMFG